MLVKLIAIVEDVGLGIEKAPNMTNFFKWLGGGDNIKGSKMYRKYSYKKKNNEYKRWLNVVGDKGK